MVPEMHYQILFRETDRSVVVENREWKSVPEEYSDEWGRLFELDMEGADLSDNCLICDKKTLHRFFQIGESINGTTDSIRYVAKGGEWQWCSTCFHYMYICYDYVPLDWTFPVRLR